MYGSSHPGLCEDAIRFSQFLKLKRLCPDDKDFNYKEKEMENFYCGRYYPRDIIERATKTKVHNITGAQELGPGEDCKIPSFLH